jgi:hypothetical protein
MEMDEFSVLHWRQVSDHLPELCSSVTDAYSMQPSNKSLDPDLKAHFTRNVALWAEWLRNGVSSDTSFQVDFHFNAAHEHNATALKVALIEQGFNVTVQERRTVIFLKRWAIEGCKVERWTLDHLQDMTRQMHVVARQTETTLEGIGASMP